jgi:hypothetical protein
LAGSASAYQTIGSDWRINEWNNTWGNPGTDYNTGPAGVDYDAIGAGSAHDGQLLVTGSVPVLNYHVTSDPTTNQTLDFSPDLAFTLEADILDTSATYTGVGNFWTLTTTFSTKGDSSWDLILMDGAEEVLRADLIAGTFSGSAVEGLTATATIDVTNVNNNQIVTAFAFLEVDPTSPYASLFGSTDYVGFDLTQVLNWEIGDLDGNYDFDDIAGAIIADVPSEDATSLISFEAEADGAVYTIASSNFIPVPEPGTGLRVGVGLLLLGLRRR